MTSKSEFIEAAYLAALPAVTAKILSENFPRETNKTISETIANLTTEIAEESYKEMKVHLNSVETGRKAL